MKCLSCETDLNSISKKRYHKKCAERLFGIEQEPSILFNYSEMATEAQKLVGQMSISGVQMKLSAKLNKKENTLESTPKGGNYILKPSPQHFPHIAENENLCMNLASELEIVTPSHGLLPLADGALIYVVKRFDRIYKKNNEIKLHVEDFAQLLEKRDKYFGSAEQIGNFLKRHSEIPFIDTQKLFIRTLFNFLIGNGDAHLKNFSMIRLPEKGYRLSEAYDIVSSRLALPKESEELALSINGKKNNLNLKDFEKLAYSLEIERKNFNRLTETASRLDRKIKNYVNSSFLPEELKRQFLSIFIERYKRLFK